MKYKYKTNQSDAAFSNACDAYGNPTVGYGLTKREYFAAMAMQGFLANSYSTRNSQLAELAVNQADSLIEELNKESVKPSELTSEEIEELKKNDEDLK